MFGTKITGVWAFTRKAAVIGLAVAGVSAEGGGLAAADEMSVPRETWSFSGLTGHYDPAQLQRGFQVYTEVCSNCHSMKLVKYRNLSEPGGPGFTEGQVKTLIKDVKFDSIDAAGNPAPRPATPADAFKSSFANDVAAGAGFGGAVPPDFSTLARARTAALNVPLYLAPFNWLKEIATGYQEGGPDYIRALLTSYHDKAPPYARDANGKLTLVPEAQAAKDSPRCVDVTPGEVGPDGKLKPDDCAALTEGLYYNSVFPGHQIHMPPPLASDGQVAYTDATRATVDQYARDVSAFMMWASDPTLDERKDTGMQMMIYLVILAALLWLAKRQIWSKLH
jgi:ubiquinol-cytochrome c reductase cytochrome c1 subunit